MFSLLMGGVAQADMASPHVIHEVQPGGTKIALHIRGSHVFHWQEDLNGYSVVRDAGNSGRYVYAKRGPSGRLVPTNHEVGKANPKALGLQRRTLPSAAVRALMRADGPAGQSSVDAAVGQPNLGPGPQTLQNLVVLVRFSDHTGRTLPSESDIDVLMNAIGGDPDLAPAGSLRDIYLNNSYGALTLNSTVVAWATVSSTEAYYADGESGLTTRIHVALAEALDIVDSSVDFNSFDKDGDGFIDAITFLHSGYAAEFGGTDSDGTYYTDRIWSHKWSLYSLPGGNWQSAEGVKVYNYHISPSVWGTSGSEIGRIGVIAHELGHFLGLPDLYDTDSDGSGIGSWGLMANSWGGDGSQEPPPLMSAWSKTALGWVTPTDLYVPGNYSLGDSLDADMVYKVTDGFPEYEYLLIENRRRKNASNAVVDNIPAYGDGLVIYHIDDSTGLNTEGYPGQAGWPENGNHYRVAVLQADGNYNLEKGDNRGDSGDAYRENFVNLIGPSTMPSTDSYKDGIVYSTDHEISNISSASSYMAFDFNLGQIPTDPPNAPSNLAATATGHYGINVTWADNSDNEEGFTLERSETIESNWTVIAYLDPNTVSFSDSGLSQGTSYSYRVKAYNSAGDSPYSNTGEGTTTVPALPTAPTSLSATDASETQIDLDWTNGDNATGLEIQRSIDGFSFQTIATLDPVETAYSDSGLSPSTTYFYQVMAFNTDGSATSELASATTQTPSPMAYATSENTVYGEKVGDLEDTWIYDGAAEKITEVLSVPNKNGRSQLEHAWQIGPVVGGAQVNLTVSAWTDPEAFEGFTFAYSIDGGITYTDALTVDSDTEGTQIVELPPQTSGTIFVRVEDTDRSRGEQTLDTVYIDYIMVESFGEIVLTAPSNLNGSALSSSEIALTWDDASGETGYTVQYHENGATVWSSAVSDLAANSTGYTITGLDPATAYDVQVCAFDDSSQSECVSTDSPITTLEDGIQNEVITITTAQYKAKAKQLLVEATSSLQPQAKLTLETFGEMTYNAADGLYVYQAKSGDPGETVTVTSNLGGSATMAVNIK
jgi:M6 family metalloprotease-like protein